MSAAWRADPAAVRSAHRLLRAATGRVVVASHNDADGLAGAVIVLRALAAHGCDRDADAGAARRTRA